MNIENKMDIENKQEAYDPLQLEAKRFVEQASEKGVAEIEAARSAVAKAQLPPVRAFAERMIREHSEANEKLKTIALAQGFEVEDDAKLTDKAKKLLLNLRSGESFDHMYIEQQVTEHKKAVDLFIRGTDSGNAKISEFARQTLPKLREHLAEAQRIQLTF